MKRTLALAFASGLVLVTAGCAQPRYIVPQQAPPPAVRHEIRVEARNYDRGFQAGYRAGVEHRGGSGAPGFLTADLRPQDRREFRRGYHEGFDKGNYDRKHGIRPRY